MTARVLTFGESMGLVRGDGIGGLEHLTAASIDTGGAEGNVAIGLSRLGVHTTWLGRIGADALGRRIAGDLRSEEVDVVAIVDDAAPTGLMLKSTPRAGSTIVDYYRAGSAGSRLRPADLDRVNVASYDLVHVTGITLALSPTARETVVTAVERARRAGVAVSFDVNHRSRLWSAEEAAPHYAWVAAHADILIAGDDEARILLGGAVDPDDLARRLAALGPSEAIVKLGAAGAVGALNGELVQVDAVAVQAVDTVGAGDAFTAAYLAERFAGADPQTRMTTAAIAGALACTHPGDWQGMPRRSDLRAFLLEERVQR